jgi:urease accessory protein
MDAPRHVAHSITAGEWLATLERGTVTLGYADRCRRRARLMDDAGTPLLVDFAYPTRLSDGDGLVTADGTIIRVIAKPEPLIEATASDAQHLTQLAKHVGDRRVPIQIMGDHSLRIMPDADLEQALRGLGADTRTVLAPFRPESGT